jgi:hypothetical protein
MSGIFLLLLNYNKNEIKPAVYTIKTADKLQYYFKHKWTHDNNKQLIKRAGFMLALTLLLLGNKAKAQTKYNLQVTGGYATSEDANVNGANIELSISRPLWKFISIGIYNDYSSVDNLQAKFNSNGSRQNKFFIPPKLDVYIKSLTASDAYNFDQKEVSFSSLGLETAFKIKVFKKFETRFYLGMGLTQRKLSAMFLSDFKSDLTTNKIIEYTPATIFIKATELSFRYGVMFDYKISKKLYVVLQVGNNTSSFRKYDTGNTNYAKANLGVSIKL